LSPQTQQFPNQTNPCPLASRYFSEGDGQEADKYIIITWQCNNFVRRDFLKLFKYESCCHFIAQTWEKKAPTILFPQGVLGVYGLGTKEGSIITSLPGQPGIRKNSQPESQISGGVCFHRITQR